MLLQLLKSTRSTQCWDIQQNPANLTKITHLRGARTGVGDDASESTTQ
jgi:hypothetical protein